MTTRKEMIVTVIFTTLIVLYPAGIGIVIGIRVKEFEHNVIENWEYFELFYMTSFIVLAIVLTTTTLLSLSHMRKVFGKENMREERSIKLMLLIFSFSYVLLVCFAVLFHIHEEWVYHLFYNQTSKFYLAVFVLWITSDAVPMLSMLIIHFKNFQSF